MEPDEISDCAVGENAVAKTSIEQMFDFGRVDDYS
jgi:hypothetical protein